jgi:hypothetical protein
METHRTSVHLRQLVYIEPIRDVTIIEETVAFLIGSNIQLKCTRRII